MRRGFAVLGLGVLLTGCANNAKIELDKVIKEATRDQLVTFESEDALRSYAEKLSRLSREEYDDDDDDAGGDFEASDSPAQAAPAEKSAAEGESVTNVQEQGVDEGGIVKTHGDHLVVLRRGRLFSIDLSDGQRRPVAMIDVPPKGAGGDTWYDEMLIHGDTIVVVGYSYGAGGTELDLFDIDAEGHIKRRSTHYLRSNDYYSSRNYASRLVGDKLIFYMPVGLFDGGGENVLSLPAQRSKRSGEWDEIVDATKVYRPIQPSSYPVLHTVVSCDLAKRKVDCSAQGVIGPYGRNFYVSPDAVYVWVSGQVELEEPASDMKEASSVVYRLPLDGSDPGALRVYGVPTDQFSFKERDQNLHVLVRADGGGEWMWNAEGASGAVALMSVPVEGITKNVGTVLEAAYKKLPAPGEGYAFQNRFIGDYVLYGSGDSWGYSEERKSGGAAVLYDYLQRGSARTVKLEHGVDRIEALGQHAMIVGSDGKNLHFSSLELDDSPSLAGHYIQQSASQGELRSHGFFFKPGGDRGGMLGLPIRGEGEPGYAHLDEGSASVLFLRVADLELAPLGDLAAQPLANADDACVASCVDWYGNARPLFYKSRMFALLGYELVEGQVTSDGVHEIGRTNFLMRRRNVVAQ